MRLKDRVAIVTGGGSGIGAASALAMAREGGRVIVADIDPAGAKATAGAIEQDGGQAIAMAVDVSRAVDNDNLVHRAVATWGRLDVFFANAGVPQPQSSIASVDEDTIDHVLAVNVKGVLLGARAALPLMKKAKRGVFLITASTAALRPRGGHVYAASKGAVVTLAASLAMEAAPHGVRVVAIAPVATDTPMLAQFAGKGGMTEEVRTRTIATVPLGRLNQPEDLARTAVFLASDDAAMITGSCIAVDGGRCI